MDCIVAFKPYRIASLNAGQRRKVVWRANDVDCNAGVMKYQKPISSETWRTERYHMKVLAFSVL
ncbi:hypothetical protein CA13_64910 [Planctomycetes bacterium CA13]|uniref:Uncharacterized protein n=1 Tax=Novipirellula herctigrandis TaxID=2527986 RepID=A0A5C5ZC67_9BACT|nr:hypothetical protein CA13_64910 [Planctomycetes bacterium CA13]